MAVIGTEAWNFSDIFKLNKIEIEATKMDVAQALKIPFKTHLPDEKCFALPVAGVEAISDENIEKITAEIMNVKHENRADFTAQQEGEWLEKLGRVSCASTVINGLMVDWMNGGMPFNKGYRPSHYHVSTMCGNILKHALDCVWAPFGILWGPF